jgi:hypothetical protein
MPTIKSLLDVKSRNALIGQLGGSQRNAFAIIVASVKEHAIGAREYLRQSDGTVARSQNDVFGSGPGRKHDTDPKAIGVIAEAYTMVGSRPDLLKLEGWPFIDAFMDLQFGYEQGHRIRGVRRVGPPACILQINELPSWVADHQGPCPDVTPIPRTEQKKKQNKKPADKSQSG